MVKIFYKNKKILLNITPENFTNIFSDKFRVIYAGGGIVYNEDNRILIIKRNNVWDFPKGKVENGENIDKTAIREVSEECGILINNLEITDTKPIYSFYIYEDREGFVLKIIYWYKMKFICCDMSHNVSMCPQTEEGITEIKWVKKSELKGYMKNSFASIKELVNSLLCKLK